MNRPLRIVVADDERNMTEFLQKGLPQLGHQVVAVAGTGRELVERCRACRPDLVVTDIKMPDMDGLDAAAAIYQTLTIPIILVSAYYDPELIERAGRNHIAAYLVKPIKQGDLETAVALAVQRFEEFQALHREAADLRQALEDRKLIERAKGLLMRKAGLDEPEAFRRLQQLSRNKNRKMSEIAQIILTAEEAYQPPESS
jgi:response regulator NasT